jgi:hypothetical protein
MGSRVRIAASVEAITSVALSSPAVTACAIAAAETDVGSIGMGRPTSFAGPSGREYRRGLGFVRQREFGDEGRHPQVHLEIGSDRRQPFRLKRKRQRQRRRFDEIIERRRGRRAR